MDGRRFASSAVAERVTVRDTVFSVRGTVLVRFRKFRPDVDYGDRLVVRLHLRRPQPARNPGAFDYRAYLERKGIHAMGSVSRSGQILETHRGKEGGCGRTSCCPCAGACAGAWRAICPEDRQDC